MPYRRRYRRRRRSRSNRRRTYRRYRRRFRRTRRPAGASRYFASSMRSRRMPIVMPPKLKVPLRATFFTPFTFGAHRSFTIACNNIFNPTNFASGLEIQPQYYDAYQAMGYRSYYVKATSFKLRIIPDLNTDTAVWMAVTFTRSPNAPAFSTQIEQENLSEQASVWTYTVPQSDDPKPVTRNFRAVTKRFYPYEDPRTIGAQFGFDPSVQYYLHILGDYSAATSGGARLEFTMTFETTLWQDLLVPAS